MTFLRRLRITIPFIHTTIDATLLGFVSSPVAIRTLTLRSIKSQYVYTRTLRKNPTLSIPFEVINCISSSPNITVVRFCDLYIHIYIYLPTSFIEPF